MTAPSIAAPNRQDGAVLHRLVVDCGGLDVNSYYFYLLWAERFAASSSLAKLDGEPVGCVLGFRDPARLDTVFIWQVAVLDAARGLGLGPAMIWDIVARPQNADLTAIEATVGPDNAASRRMFQKVAERAGATLTWQPGFPADQFPDPGHGAEDLLRIAPFPERGDAFPLTRSVPNRKD